MFAKQTKLSKRFDCLIRFGDYEGRKVSSLSHDIEDKFILAEILKTYKHEMYADEKSCYEYHINPFAPYSMSLDDFSQ